MSEIDLERLDLLDEQQVDGVALALAILGSRSEWIEIKQVQWIKVARVVAVAWNLGRLEDCRSRLRAGEKPPAINVSRYRISKKIFYTLSDGNHRTIAARETGHSTIKAQVEGECTVEINQFMLEPAEGRLWMQVQGQPGTQVMVNHVRLKPEVVAVLGALGVQ